MIVADDSRLPGSTVCLLRRLPCLFAWCSVATTQDEFTSVRNPLLLTGIQETIWSNYFGNHLFVTGCTFIIIFLQLFTALGFGKSTASILCFIQYLCLNIASQCSLPGRMCALPWNYREIKTCPQGRSQDLVPLYLLDCELRPSPLP